MNEGYEKSSGQIIKKSVRRALYTASALLFVAVLVLSTIFQWEIYKKAEEIKLYQTEYMWSSRILSMQHLCNLLSQQPQLFTSEEKIRKLLSDIYLEYEGLIAYPAFGTIDGKMLTYPYYDYPPEYDPRKRPWYIEAIKNPKKVVIVKPFLHGILKEPTLAVAKAVFDENNKLIGVIAFDLVASKISDRILTEGSYIIDEKENLLAKKGNAFQDVNFSNLVENNSEIYVKYIGNNHYLVKRSIGGTYVVSEHSLFNHIIPIVLPAFLFTSILILIGLILSEKLALFLETNISKPIQELVIKTKEYLLKGTFDFESKSDVYEICLLKK